MLAVRTYCPRSTHSDTHRKMHTHLSLPHTLISVNQHKRPYAPFSTCICIFMLLFHIERLAASVPPECICTQVFLYWGEFWKPYSYTLNLDCLSFSNIYSVICAEWLTMKWEKIQWLDIYRSQLIRLFIQQSKYLGSRIKLENVYQAWNHLPFNI